MTATTLPVDPDERNAFLETLVRPMPRATYKVDYRLVDIEGGLTFLAEGASLNLIPDFQRGHIWTQAQQERWIEAVLRGAIGSSGLLIQFNAPDWSRDRHRNSHRDLTNEVVCVDGLQRLTAARRFVAGEIRAFGLTAQVKGLLEQAATAKQTNKAMNPS